jgi:hypothetical protein
MATFTIAEVLKTQNDPLIQAIYQKFVETTPFVANTQFRNSVGTSVDQNRRATLPAQAFRALNGTVTPSISTTSRFNTPIAHAGTIFESDDFLMKVDPSRIADELDQQITAMTMNINRVCFKGDKGSNNEFDGLQVLTGVDGGSNPERTGQVIANGATGLSLSKLDEALIKTKGTAKAIYVSEDILIKMQRASRDSAVAGNVNFTPETMGQSIMRYSGVPIYWVGEDVDGSDILGYTEGVGTDETSVYVVAHDNGPIIDQVGGLDRKEIDGDFSTKVSTAWDLALSIRDLRSVQRISGILDSAIIA